MSKKVMVICETQKEWDIVSTLLGYTWKNGRWLMYEEKSCITLAYQSYGDYTNLSSDRYTFISFKEFCKLKNYKIEMLEEKGMKELMLEVLNKTYDNQFLRKNTVPLFMSDPGLGKSTIVEEFAASKGVNILHTILSTRMPNEVAGGVMPNSKRGFWEVLDNEDLASLKDGDIWFIDEVFNGTLKQTLDSLLNVLGSRRLPSGKLLANIMIVAASNPQGLIQLTPQIKERFIRYNLKFCRQEYQNYLEDKYGIPKHISTHLCTLVEKEKYENNEWSYFSPRSIEKAIVQIGYGLESPLEDKLLPYLKIEIESPMDFQFANIKTGDKIEFLELLKPLINKT